MTTTEHQHPNHSLNHSPVGGGTESGRRGDHPADRRPHRTDRDRAACASSPTRPSTRPARTPSGAGHCVPRPAHPATPAAELGRLDVVLFSHDQHPDNLDGSGRRTAPDRPRGLQHSAAPRAWAANTTAMEPWHHVDLPRPDGGTLTRHRRSRATRARQHRATSPVMSTGFVLSGDGLPNVYVSGDNASLRRRRRDRRSTAARFTSRSCLARARAHAVLDAYLTLTSDQAARGGAHPRCPGRDSASRRRLGALHARTRGDRRRVRAAQPSGAAEGTRAGRERDVRGAQPKVTRTVRKACGGTWKLTSRP